MFKCRKRKGWIPLPLFTRRKYDTSCKDFVLQYNESRGEIFELAHASATLVHGSEVLD